MSPAAVTAVVLAYIALLFLIAWLSGRHADNAGFFTGNRRSSWFVTALSMITAAMSGVTYLSVPGSVAADSFSYMQMVLGFTVGQLVVAFLLVPLFYRMRVISLYQYLDHRFGVTAQRTGAWFFFLSKMLGAALRLYIVCAVMQLLVFDRVGLPFAANAVVTVLFVWLYTRRGGVKSLIWTDAFKTLCLVASLVLTILALVRGLGLTTGEALREVAAVKQALENNIENYRFRAALQEAMNIARIGNKYLADTEPWKVIKSDPERVKTILYVALQITANTAIAIEPFMPFSAAKLRRMLSVEGFDWERMGATDLIEAGHHIGTPELLFEKIEDDVIQRQLDKLAATKAANAAAEAAQHVEAQKDEITFDDFQKMDIRVSTILSAEKVAKTKKLLHLTVDTGIDQRDIVSGIAEYFTPEELVGRQVLVLVNLAPRTLKGIVSRGMILMGEDATGKLRLLGPDEKTSNGAIVG